MTSYNYIPLDGKGRHFRLLRINPGRRNSFDDAVSCSLSTFSLDDPPVYETLSYTWGSLRHTASVTVDAEEFLMTSNLATALRYLRDLSDGRWFWIDAICINQSDLHERNEQVKIMKSILEQAQSVRVWLGDPLANRAGLRVLRDAAREVYKDAHSLTRDEWRFCADIFRHSWFARVWTVQEFALAKRVTFQCGAEQLDYKLMVLSMDSLVESLSTNRFVKVLEQHEHIEIMILFSRFRDLVSIKRLCDETTGNAVMSFRAFATILAVAQGKQAVDPRDKVYGMLALAPPSFMEFVSPDYSLQVDEVYANLALYLESRLDPIRLSIEEDYLKEGSVSTPDWVSSWINALFTWSSEVSRRLQTTDGKPKDNQDTVVECLKILSFDAMMPSNEDTYLSEIEKGLYRSRFDKAFNTMKNMLSRRSSTSGVQSRVKTNDGNDLEEDDHSLPALTMLNDFQFSDSGYSSASSSRGDTALVAEAIAAHLLSHDFLQALLVRAAQVEPGEDVLERQLRPRLKFYGQELEKAASESKELLAAHELKRHAPLIAKALITRHRASHLEEDGTVKEQREVRIGVLLERRSSIHRGGLRSYSADVDEEIRDASSNDIKGHQDFARQDHDEVPLLQMSESALEEVKQFMTSDIAFSSFLQLICRMVYSDPLEAIKFEVHRRVGGRNKQSEAFEAVFNVSWEFGAFLDREVANSVGCIDYDRLLTLLVISGTPKVCYATNCVSYLEWMWPDSSRLLLEAICGRTAAKLARRFIFSIMSQTLAGHSLTTTRSSVGISFRSCCKFPTHPNTSKWSEGVFSRNRSTACVACCSFQTG